VFAARRVSLVEMALTERTESTDVTEHAVRRAMSDLPARAFAEKKARVFAARRVSLVEMALTERTESTDVTEHAVRRAMSDLEDSTAGTDITELRERRATSESAARKVIRVNADCKVNTERAAKKVSAGMSQLWEIVNCMKQCSCSERN